MTISSLLPDVRACPSCLPALSPAVCCPFFLRALCPSSTPPLPAALCSQPILPLRPSGAPSNTGLTLAHPRVFPGCPSALRPEPELRLPSRCCPKPLCRSWALAQLLPHLGCPSHHPPRASTQQLGPPWKVTQPCPARAKHLSPCWVCAGGSVQTVQLAQHPHSPKGRPGNFRTCSLCTEFPPGQQTSVLSG